MSTPPLPRTPYPTDVSDEEWAFVAPYLTLLSEDAGQRRHDLREVFNALRWIVRAGASWRLLPHDFPRLRDCLPADTALAGRRLLRGAGPLQTIPDSQPPPEVLEHVMNRSRNARFKSLSVSRTALHCLPQTPMISAF